jgi:hypothetical protein
MARRGPVNTGRTSGKKGLGTGSGMMGWGFDVDPSPREINKILGKELSKDLKSAWKPALEGAGLVMSGHVLETFDQQGAPIGRRWPTGLTHWRKHYLKQKQEAGHGSTPMVRKGKLRKQLEKRKPVSLTNKKVAVGVRGKRWPMIQYLQFHKGYYFVEWNKNTADTVQEVFDHHGNQIMKRAAEKLGRG